jgi:hypothetical protein
VFDKGLMGMALEDDRGEQRRIDRAATGRAVFEAWHVIDAYKCAVPVEHRERAAKADVDAEILKSWRRPCNCIRRRTAVVIQMEHLLAAVEIKSPRETIVVDPPVPDIIETSSSRS